MLCRSGLHIHHRLSRTSSLLLRASGASSAPSTTTTAPQSNQNSTKKTNQMSDQASSSKKKGPSQGELVRAQLLKAPAPLVDIGINLVDSSFAKDREEVIERAREAGVACMIVTGTCVGTSRSARDLVDATTSYPLYFTAGVHPHHAKECNDHTLDELRKLLSHPKCVAVGETGLDFNRNFSPPDVQEKWFDAQVALAVELRKPLFMHCRDAADKFAEILRRHAPLPALSVIHCFTGTRAELEAFLELGLCIGITGWICDERPERGGAELASLLSHIPPDRLMIETDAPYLVPRTITPSKARPGRNEPALLPHVLKMAAKSLGETEEAVAIRTTKVAQSVFGISVPGAQ